jgi:signal transduction histidine kinase
MGGGAIRHECTKSVCLVYRVNFHLVYHARDRGISGRIHAAKCLSLQILLCLVAVPLLFLSAVMSEARRTAETVRNTSGNLIDSQEQERRRISRELHDDLGQALALAMAKLDELREGSHPSVQPGLTDLFHQLSSISTTAREISHGLYPSQLEYVGLSTAVKRLCDEIGRGKRPAIRLAVSRLPQLPPSISLCFYRILQEALHNVMNSLARNVEVRLAADNRRVLLRIVDDGVGFDPSCKTEGLGLPSMRERVRSVGGTIEIASSPGTGTQIEVQVNFGQDDPRDFPRAA